MADWLTTHYAHRDADDEPWHIFLQRQYRDAVSGIAVGDRVFFYEYRGCRQHKHRSDRREGAQGIVRVGTVSGGILYDRDAEVEYADGTVADWCWRVPTENIDAGGFVSRADVLKVIGYKPNSYLRGFNGGTGVMRLSAGQGKALLLLFKSGASQDRQG